MKKYLYKSIKISGGMTINGFNKRLQKVLDEMSKQGYRFVTIQEKDFLTGASLAIFEKEFD